MSLLGDVAGLVSGFISDKKTNKMSRKQLKRDQALTDRQVDISKYIDELAREIVSKNPNFTDAYGAGAVYDPATGTYKTTLNPQEKSIQDASYAEELKRYIQDQAIRRSGLTDFEDMRKRSVDETTNALADINAFKRGVNRVDPAAIASQLRADRTGAVNAGYDDAARAAQTLQLRTGNSAIGDALSQLARDRGRAIATTVGSPEVEALGMADQLNTGREKNLFDIYGMFGNEGRSFYDANYAPSGYNEAGYDKLKDAMNFDLSKYDLALGGEANAAAAISHAQTGDQNAFQNFMGNRITNPTGKLIGGLDQSLEDAVMKVIKSGIGK
jgi:hypothetical protein